MNPRPGRQPVSMQERFLSRIERTDTCWLWRGFTTPTGYGRFSRGGRKGKLVLAHRYAWEMAHGSIPDGAVVCHRCDVRNCVRVEHLFIGSQAANVADAVGKGRHRPPVERKLQAADVEEIRRRAVAGETQRAIAADYGINRSTVSMIVNGHRWKGALAS